ncbi:hypothetical protein STRTUCAR8_08598 [Streptomyces turgidiscabies Car8]|uniref:Uncharacterized protein n=1 Tax=Streptomyces turgidiscabies (strain Car8) TaxID=698760 RepID=L7F9D3_STRT8|nr:hypothetical protein [Streptomyces turgidiscabies]ELP67641.1 hypothetical protein STRTUCAR8_08598 [Streptomyces turgidiscabies Car8]
MTKPDDAHICKPGSTVYYCPASGETESDCHGGFDQCCDQPEEHRPVSTVLRDHLAAALIARIKQAVVPAPFQPGGAVGSIFAATEFDLADTALSAFTDHLDIGAAEAWCKTCRRVWGGRHHQCESDAEQRLVRVRAALASFDGRGVITPGGGSLDIPTAGEVLDAVRTALTEPTKDTP